ARPVGLARRPADQARDRAPHRRRRHEERDQGPARGELRRHHPRGAAAPWLRPPRLVAPDRRNHRRSRSRRGGGLGGAARGGAGGTAGPARSGAGAAAGRRAPPLRGLMEKAGLLFVAGFASIAFPCVPPLLPGYLSAVSAVEAQRLGDPGVGRRVALASLPFIAGFAVVFVALGAAARGVSNAATHTHH